MTLSHFDRAMTAGVTGVLLLAGCSGGFSFSFMFTVPERAEDEQTRTIALPTEAVVRITNETGTTRVTVDPSAEEATLEIMRIAFAESQEQADALLEQMAVQVTEPDDDENVLTIVALRPEGAAVDEGDFQLAISEDDEVSITGIFGTQPVAQYELRLTLPAGHRVEGDQGVGRIRTVALDRASLLSADRASVRSIGASAALDIVTARGRVTVDAHQGSLDITTDSGRIEMEIVALAADDDVLVRSESGRVELDLPSEINASLRALSGSSVVLFDEDDFASVSDLRDAAGFVETTLGTGGAAIDLQTESVIDIDGF